MKRRPMNKRIAFKIFFSRRKLAYSKEQRLRAVRRVYKVFVSDKSFPGFVYPAWWHQKL